MKRPDRIPPGAKLSIVSLQVIAYYALRGYEPERVILCPAITEDYDSPRDARERARELLEDVLAGRPVGTWGAPPAFAADEIVAIAIVEETARRRVEHAYDVHQCRLMRDLFDALRTANWLGWLDLVTAQRSAEAA